MERATVRRRRLALATLALLAAAGLAAGVIVGGGSGGSGTGGSGGDRSGGSTSSTVGSTAVEEKRPTLAERLTPSQLAGERVVVSIDGTGLTEELRHAIRAGKVAGVVLFEADFPSRAAGRELIDAVQSITRPQV